MAVIVTMLGICAMFKSYPSIGDMGLYLSVLSLYRHTFPCKIWIVVLELVLTFSSDAVYLLCDLNSPIRQFPWTGVLSSLDLRGLRKC